MTPMGQLPNWVDMGGDTDYATPTGTLVDALRKRMKQKPQSGAGAAAGGMLNDSPAYSQILGGSIKPVSPSGGVKSL